MLTKRTPRPSRLLAVFAVVAVLAVAPAAIGDVKQECSAAYVDVQKLRKQGKLGAAHVRGVVCAQDVCGATMPRECAKWVKEIDESQPTLVFAATDASGGDATEVHVLLDGELLQASIDGKPRNADPGTHKLRFELAGAEAIEQSITVNEGEKSRKVSVAFGKPKRLEPASAPPVTTPPVASTARPAPPIGTETLAGSSAVPMRSLHAPADASSGRAIQATLGIVGIAVGVAGLGLGVVTGALAIGKHNALEKECSATSCPPSAQSDRDSYYTMGALSTIGFIVAGVGAGAGTVLLATAPKSATPAAHRVAPWVGMGHAGLTGSF